MSAFAILLLVTLSLLFSGNARAESGVIISEIMFNPDGNENAREFVELYNGGSSPVYLEGWLIGDGSADDKIVPVADGGWGIPAGAYALIFDPDYFGLSTEPYSDIPADTPLFIVTDKALGSRGLSNSTAETVRIVNGDGELVEAVKYDIACSPGHSWERVTGSGETFFRESLQIDGTPGREYLAALPDYCPVILPEDLHLLQISDNDCEISLCYRNHGAKTLSVIEIDVIMRPDRFIGTMRFSNDTAPGEQSDDQVVVVDNVPLGYNAFVVAFKGADADSLEKLYINSRGETEVIINEVMAAPSDGGSEWVELYNIGETSVSLYNWQIYDSVKGAPRLINSFETLNAGMYAVIAVGPVPNVAPDAVFVENAGCVPSLNNDGDSVRLYAASVSAFIDSMYYESTVSGKSLERISIESDQWEESAPIGGTPGAANSMLYDIGTIRLEPVLTVDPNPFGETAEISYTLDFPRARVSLTVFDRRGRFITKLRDAEDSGSKWSYEWDGCADGSRVPAGPYILRLEALNRDDGKVSTVTKTIVAGSRL